MNRELLDESELSKLLISLLLLPPVDFELEPELEEPSLVPAPDADVGKAKASAAFLIEPPSVSGESLSSVIQMNLSSDHLVLLLSSCLLLEGYVS
jgi:hypothetical protein